MSAATLARDFLFCALFELVCIIRHDVEKVNMEICTNFYGMTEILSNGFLCKLYTSQRRVIVLYYLTMKGGLYMPTSEAQKRARDKYDKENMDRVTIKVKKDLLQRFRQVVQDNGSQVNTEFRLFMERYIKDNTIE